MQNVVVQRGYTVRDCVKNIELCRVCKMVCNNITHHFWVKLL